MRKGKCSFTYIAPEKSKSAGDKIFITESESLVFEEHFHTNISAFDGPADSFQLRRNERTRRFSRGFAQKFEFPREIDVCLLCAAAVFITFRMKFGIFFVFFLILSLVLHASCKIWLAEL